jgi:hypothetical protein
MTKDRHGIDEENKAVPPYEGRRESGRAKGPETSKKGPRTGGATGPVEDPEMKAEEPDRTPGGATASPADEKAAGRMRGAEDPDEQGTGPAHQRGVHRAEDES